MAGTVRGSIEHRIVNTSIAGLRDLFAMIAKFFNNHPQMVRIAWQKGGPTDRLGDGRLDGLTGEANYSGQAAFGVWRWDQVGGAKIYILLQWEYANGIGSVPGNPGVMNGTYGMGIAFALDTSGGNPWNGGTANAGSDTKNGTNVWVANGGTLLVWPRSNSLGGISPTIRQYLLCLFTQVPNVAATRLHVMTDDDNLWWAIDANGTGGYDCLGFFGKYTPRSGITPTAGAGFISFSVNANENAWPSFASTAYGEATPTTDKEGGAVIVAADGVKTYAIETIGNLSSSLLQPNTLVSPAQYDQLDMVLRLVDPNVPTRYGLFGKLDAMPFVYNVPTHATNVGKTKVVFGPTPIAQYKVLMPWDGVTVPGSGGTVTGIQF